MQPCTLHCQAVAAAAVPLHTIQGNDTAWPGVRAEPLGGVPRAGTARRNPWGPTIIHPIFRVSKWQNHDENSHILCSTSARHHPKCMKSALCLNDLQDNYSVFDACPRTFKSSENDHGNAPGPSDDCACPMEERTPQRSPPNDRCSNKCTARDTSVTPPVDSGRMLCQSRRTCEIPDP